MSKNEELISFQTPSFASADEDVRKSFNQVGTVNWINNKDAVMAQFVIDKIDFEIIVNTLGSMDFKTIHEHIILVLENIEHVDEFIKNGLKIKLENIINIYKDVGTVVLPVIAAKKIITKIYN